MPKYMFLKDVLFLQLVLLFLLGYSFHGKINIWMSEVFFVLYLLYLIALLGKLLGGLGAVFSEGQARKHVESH